MIKFLRNNIGTITASVGMIILVILTFGDIGELFTEAYWKNVGGNVTSIGVLSIGLSLTQWTIKQGVAEQSLQAGLNKKRFLTYVDSEGVERIKVDENGTPVIDPSCTPAKFEEHTNLVTKNREREIYLIYYLSEYNKRETARRRLQFLADNDFTSEKALLEHRLRWYQFILRSKIKKYKRIKTNWTTDSMKWSSTDIQYDKYGCPRKLSYFRSKRAITGLLWSAIAMVGVAFITGGFFLDSAPIIWWQKLVKLASYIIIMGITVVMSIIKNFEKGAFGVANELGEINSRWWEFTNWIPSNEVERKVKILRGEINETEQIGNDIRPNTPVKPTSSQGVQDIEPDSLVLPVRVGYTLCDIGSSELNRECG